jgi:hypothetical protein
MNGHRHSTERGEQVSSVTAADGEGDQIHADTDPISPPLAMKGSCSELGSLAGQAQVKRRSSAGQAQGQAQCWLAPDPPWIMSVECQSNASGDGCIAGMWSMRNSHLCIIDGGQTAQSVRGEDDGSGDSPPEAICSGSDRVVWDWALL